VDVVRELALMVDSIVENKPKASKEHYDNMLRMFEESHKIQHTMLEEIASVGSLLISRGDFLHLMFKINELADYAEAVAFRLNGILSRKWKFDTEKMREVSELTTLILDEVSKMRETMLALSHNPFKAVELSKMVEELERKIDSNYRTLNLEILSANMSIQLLLLFRDITEHLERMADITVDIVDLIKVLALSA
jgi:uncharacterized protein Yka (UPF0111/DUF47 family)